jgi:hypothetical protein
MTTRPAPNKRAAGQRRSSLLVRFEHRWPGVPERGRSATTARMKFIAPLILAALLCGCTGPEHVSPAEFKKQYGLVGEPQTMHSISYLGQRDGKAFIRVSSMSTVSKKWSDHIIYVELTELDLAFRHSLPKIEFKK